MTTETLIPLLIFLFPLAYSPGPGNSFFATLGAARGLGGCWPALAGYHVATLALTLAVGLGFHWIQALGPGVFRALQWAGAAYMIWLAILFARAGASGTDPALPAKTGFLAGLALLLFNPKAWTILSLLFSQFPGGSASGIAAITLVFTLNNLLAFVIWARLGEALARLFRTRASARALNLAFAAALMGVAIRMLP